MQFIQPIARTAIVHTVLTVSIAAQLLALAALKLTTQAGSVVGHPEMARVQPGEAAA